ncbi:MAG: hypothetical protein KDA37_08215 [Planctomycetales bacterium]|nr:hypothetical protein [Planctomycetales bacterium]
MTRRPPRRSNSDDTHEYETRAQRWLDKHFYSEDPWVARLKLWHAWIALGTLALLIRLLIELS